MSAEKPDPRETARLLSSLDLAPPMEFFEEPPYLSGPCSHTRPVFDPRSIVSDAVVYICSRIGGVCRCHSRPEDRPLCELYPPVDVRVSCSVRRSIVCDPGFREVVRSGDVSRWRGYALYFQCLAAALYALSLAYSEWARWYGRQRILLSKERVIRDTGLPVVEDAINALVHGHQPKLIDLGHESWYPLADTYYILLGLMERVGIDTAPARWPRVRETLSYCLPEFAELLDDALRNRGCVVGGVDYCELDLREREASLMRGLGDKQR